MRSSPSGIPPGRRPSPPPPRPERPRPPPLRRLRFPAIAGLVTRAAAYPAPSRGTVGILSALVDKRRRRSSCVARMRIDFVLNARDQSRRPVETRNLLHEALLHSPVSDPLRLRIILTHYVPDILVLAPWAGDVLTGRPTSPRGHDRKQRDEGNPAYHITPQGLRAEGGGFHERCARSRQGLA